MKTYRFLKSEEIATDVIAKRFAGKAQIELLTAVHNPDHSVAAVQALTAMLNAQGMTNEQIEAFRWDHNELDVLPISKRPSIDGALRRPKRWRVIYRSIQILSLILFIAFIYSVDHEEKARQAKVDELIARGVIPKDEYRAWRESGIFKYRTMLNRSDITDTPGVHVIGYEYSERTGNVDNLNEKVLQHFAPQDAPGSALSATLILAVLLLFGPVKLAAWRWPARILLLRPFNVQDVSKSLKRFIRRNVSFSGHVFTLADRHMKESLFLYLISFVPLSPEGVLVLLLYPWSKRTRRRIYVKKASDFRALKSRLGSRWLLNTFWTNSLRDKIRKIRTADSWWQRCIDLLAANCEVILVDLTLVKAGTRWELSKLRDQKLEEKAIFIVQQERLEHGRAVLAEYWPAAGLPKIYSYDEKGQLENPTDFANHLATVMSLPRPAFTGKPRLYFWAVFSMFTWLNPVLGLPVSLYAWLTIARSEGRLKGKALAQISTALNLILLAIFLAANLRWVLH